MHPAGPHTEALCTRARAKKETSNRRHNPATTHATSVAAGSQFMVRERWRYAPVRAAIVKGLAGTMTRTVRESLLAAAAGAPETHAWPSLWGSNCPGRAVEARNESAALEDELARSMDTGRYHSQARSAWGTVQRVLCGVNVGALEVVSAAGGFAFGVRC